MAKDVNKTVNKVEDNARSLMVERERFVSNRDNKEYWGYFIRGVVRGREVKVNLAPPDNGGYEVLDLVFGDSATAELVLIPYEIEDEKTKRVQRGFTYEARNIGEDGEIYGGAIKPFKRSDKDTLDMLLSRLNKTTAA